MDGEINCKLTSFILWEESSRHYSNDVIICTVNTISAVFALFCNLAIIVTIKKKNLIQTPRDILIGSLTLLDCIVPLVAKPLFIALRMSLHDDHVTCSRLQQLTKATELAVMFGCGCSLTHIVLIAGDRYLALRKPIKYRRPRTKKGEKLGYFINQFFKFVRVLFYLYKERVSPATLLGTLERAQRRRQRGLG